MYVHTAPQTVREDLVGVDHLSQEVWGGQPLRKGSFNPVTHTRRRMLGGHQGWVEWTHHHTPIGFPGFPLSLVAHPCKTVIGHLQNCHWTGCRTPQTHSFPGGTLQIPVTTVSLGRVCDCFPEYFQTTITG